MGMDIQKKPEKSGKSLEILKAVNGQGFREDLLCSGKKGILSGTEVFTHPLPPSLWGYS